MSVPPRSITQSRHRRADVAGVERRRALGGEPLDRRRRARGRARTSPSRGTRRRRSSARATPAWPSRSAPSMLPQQRLRAVDLDARRARARSPGAASSVSGTLAEARGRLGDPRRHAVDAARRRADVEDLHGVAEVDHDGVQRRALAGRAESAATMKSSSTGVAARRRDEHVAARAEPGQQRLGHERRHQRGQRRVDRVAAGAQDLRAGLGGQGVAGRDDAALSHPRPPESRSDVVRTAG